MLCSHLHPRALDDCCLVQVVNKHLNDASVWDELKQGQDVLKDATRNPQTCTKAGFGADDWSLDQRLHILSANLSHQNRVLHRGWISPYLCFKIVLWSARSHGPFKSRAAYGLLVENNWRQMKGKIPEYYPRKFLFLQIHKTKAWATHTRVILALILCFLWILEYHQCLYWA